MQGRSSWFRTDVVYLYLAQFLVIAAGYVVNPVISLYALSLGASIGTASLVVTSSSIVPVLGQIPVGYLADRVGKGLFLYIGATVAMVTPVLSYLAPNVPELLAVRVVSGLALTMFVPISWVLVMELAPGKNYGKSIGNIAAATQVGVFVGPLIGGFVGQVLG